MWALDRPVPVSVLREFILTAARFAQPLLRLLSGGSPDRFGRDQLGGHECRVESGINWHPCPFLGNLNDDRAHRAPRSFSAPFSFSIHNNNGKNQRSLAVFELPCRPRPPAAVSSTLDKHLLTLSEHRVSSRRSILQHHPRRDSVLDFAVASCPAPTGTHSPWKWKPRKAFVSKRSERPCIWAFLCCWPAPSRRHTTFRSSTRPRRRPSRSAPCPSSSSPSPAFIFVVVEGILFYSIFRFRRRTHGDSGRAAAGLREQADRDRLDGSAGADRLRARARHGSHPLGSQRRRRRSRRLATTRCSSRSSANSGGGSTPTTITTAGNWASPRPTNCTSRPARRAYPARFT